MGFSEDYRKFVDYHRARRRGTRLDRLRNGLGHAEREFLENVWWPTFHQFDDLHPEYEVFDYKDGYRYLDFAYVLPNFRMAIEIDGFGPHWRNITKYQHADSSQRQNHLIIDGWVVMRFAYLDVSERPRHCQQTLQQVMGRWLTADDSVARMSVLEREIVRIAIRSPKPITPRDVSSALRIGADYAHKLLHSLVDDQWLVPASGKVRIRSYRLHKSRSHIKL